MFHFYLPSLDPGCEGVKITHRIIEIPAETNPAILIYCSAENIVRLVVSAAIIMKFR